MNPYNQHEMGNQGEGHHHHQPQGMQGQGQYGMQGQGQYGMQGQGQYGMQGQGQYGMQGQGQYGINQGMGMDQGIGSGLNLNQQYKFSSQSIQNNGMQIFQQCDLNQSGTLSVQEGERAIQLFCQQNGQPMPDRQDIQTMLAMYDYDGSGQLDYGEFKMLLEHMGGVRSYGQQEIKNARSGRGQRIEQYQQGSVCNLF